MSGGGRDGVLGADRSSGGVVHGPLGGTTAHTDELAEDGRGENPGASGFANHGPDVQSIDDDSTVNLPSVDGGADRFDGAGSVQGTFRRNGLGHDGFELGENVLFVEVLSQVRDEGMS